MNWRLIGWSVLVAFMSAVSYAAQLSSGPPAKDVAYQWSSSVLGAVQYALIFGIIMLLTRGLDRRRFLALRRPRTSWRRAAGIGAVVILVVFVVSAVVAQFANAEREQGLIPQHWNPSKIAPFAAFCFVVVVIAPIVEELLFRGVGYGLLAPVRGVHGDHPRRVVVRSRPRADRRLRGDRLFRSGTCIFEGENGQHLSLHAPPCVLQCVRARDRHRDRRLAFRQCGGWRRHSSSSSSSGPLRRTQSRT